MNSITNNLRVGFDAKFLFADTERNEIKTEDVYEDFYGDKNLFDFSDYH